MGNHCSSKQSEKENINVESGSQQIQAESPHAPAGSDKCEHKTESPTNHVPDKVEPELSIQLCSQKVLCLNKSPEVKAKIISFNIRYKNPFMEEERQLRRQKLDQVRKRAKSDIRWKKKKRRKLVYKRSLSSVHKPVTGDRKQRNLWKIYARTAENLYHSESSDTILESSGGDSYASKRSRRSMYNISKSKSCNEFYSEGSLVRRSARFNKSRRRRRRYKADARTDQTLSRVRDASSGSNDNSSIIPLVNEPLVHVLKPLPQEEKIKESQARKNGLLFEESSPEKLQWSSRQASPASKEVAPIFSPCTKAGNGCLSRAKTPSSPSLPESAQQQAQAEDSDLENSVELYVSQVTSESWASASEKGVSQAQTQQSQAAEEKANKKS